MTDRAVFDTYAEFYDLLYEGKDTAGEVEWILHELHEAGMPNLGSVLELGAGTGRHAVAFADRGHRVVAVEPSQPMLDKAREHRSVHYIKGDARAVRVGEKFDAVLSLFHVLSYHTEPDDVRGFFETASQHLPSGGLLGFDVWYSPAVHFLRPEARVLSRENEALEISRSATATEELNRSVVTVDYACASRSKETGVQTSFRESHVMRHFTATEITSFATEHSFDVVSSKEFMTNAEPSRETWGVWFTLRKI
jgi:SAM-dependent methyltransferase